MKPATADSALKLITQQCVNRRDYHMVWDEVWRRAVADIGPVVHRGNHWSQQVESRAAEYLAVLGVSYEQFAGQRYVGGRRVYWGTDGFISCWRADDYRP